MPLPQKGVRKRNNTQKTLSSQPLTKWFTPPIMSKSKTSPQWKPTSVPLGKSGGRKQNIEVRNVINLEKSVFVKENDLEVNKEIEVINLLDDGDVASSAKPIDRFSMDSQITQKNNSFFAPPNDSNSLQAQRKHKRIRLDEFQQKDGRRHAMIQSSFGLVQLKPIPPELFSDLSSVAIFPIMQLNPPHLPIPLKKNYILGRSAMSASEKFCRRRKRKRNEENKIDIGIPISAKGVSRNHIKICDIYIGRNDAESHVTFQVMECVKNEFFVVIREKWVKPQIGGKFILRFGDCILFDIYEWLENKPAQYVFQLVRCKNNNLSSDEKVIDVEGEDMCATNVNERTSKQENNTVQLGGISHLTSTVPTKKLTKSCTSGKTNDCLAFIKNKGNDTDQQLHAKNQENEIKKELYKSQMTKAETNLSCSSNLHSCATSFVNNNIENNKDETESNSNVAIINQEKVKPLQDFSLGTENLPITTKTKKERINPIDINKTVKVTSKSNPYVAPHNQTPTIPESNINLDEKSSPTLNKNLSLIKRDIKEEPIKIEENMDESQNCMTSKVNQSSSLQYSTSQESDIDHQIQFFDAKDEFLITEYVYNTLLNLQFYYSPKDEKIGLECIHCCNSKSKFRIFPSSSRVLKSIYKQTHHHLERCQKVPKKKLHKINALKSSWLQQYTKVKPKDEDTFYDNFWERMQKTKLLLKHKFDGKTNIDNKDGKNTNIISESIIAKNVDNECNIGVVSPNICVGDRIAIEFEAFDLFGEPKKKRKQWYFAHVLNIEDTGPVPRFNVEYDDKVQELITYSMKDVVKLQETSDGAMLAVNCCTYAEIIGYSPPNNICIGDIVDVRTLNREKWYRGRIAKVDQKQNKCSVAYDDEDYEIDIPIDFQNVRLVKRGWKCCKWLDNLSVRISCRQTKVWKILPQCDDWVIPESPEDITLKVMNGRISQIFQYKELVQKLFIPLHKKAKAENRIRQWRLKPYVSKLPKRNLAVVTKQKPTCEKNQQETTYNAIEVPTLDVGETNNLVTPGHSPLRDEDNSHQSDTIIDSTLTNVLQKKSQIITSDASEMLVSQSNSFWRALSSTEPCVGYRILKHAATIQKLIPNKYLLKNLSDSLIYGLKSEGIKLFDSNKSELTSRFTSFLLKQYSGVKMKNGKKYNMSYLTWDDIKFSLVWTVNLTSPTMNDANAGILEAMHAIEFVSSLLVKDKEDIIHTGENELVYLRALKEKEQHRAILQIFNCLGGVREALKYVVKCTAKSWFYHGNSVLCSDSFKNNTSFAASRCLNAHGIIVSVVAWLFCITEKIDVGDKKCLYLIRDTFDNEISLMMSGNKRKQDYSIPFVLSLYAQKNEKLCMTLASLFDVRETVATILNI